MYVDALGLLKYICDVVLFLLCCLDGKHSEQVEDHAIAEQLVGHSPWAFQRDTLKIHKRVAFCLLDKDLVPPVLALRRKQIGVERNHLACSSGHCALGILGGFLGLLKISLEISFHGVFVHLGCSFGFLGFFLGFLGFL
jgi:hypothetical protein